MIKSEIAKYFLTFIQCRNLRQSAVEEAPPPYSAIDSLLRHNANSKSRGDNASFGATGNAGFNSGNAPKIKGSTGPAANSSYSDGSLTSDSVSRSTLQQQEMASLQRQMQEELQEQKKLKEAQEKLLRIKKKTNEMELARIKMENQKLREETIETASRTKTLTQVGNE